MGLIVDTSGLFASEKGKYDLTGFFAFIGDEPVRIASITASELLHGVARADTPARREKRSRFVESMLHLLPVVDFDLTLARHHAALWAELEKSGNTIGPHDMLIAATALACGDRMATLNTAEFARVPSLKLADLSAYRTP